jgi:NAD(P)-dependent dehydrogenase (short-subunit alcohol dehydrogenase family)/acyl carrier protein
VLLPADDEHARPVLRAAQRAGFRVIRVRPGTEYAAGRGEFRIRPDQPRDVERVLAELASAGTEPDVLVHALTAAPWPRPDHDLLPGQLGTAYFSLHALAKAAVLRPSASAPRVVAITAGSVDVTGAERIDPVKATVHGLVRTLLSEAPHLAGGVIDIGDRVSVADLAEELSLPLRAEVVALRRRHRWVPVEAPLPLPATPREPIREDGVYLITGGFGGLGLALAQGLAETGLCPKLILLGRHDPTTGTGARADRVGTAIAELRALGAEVHTAACNVTDSGALRAAVAGAPFGPVNGVFHLAGVAGGRMIAFREQADAVEVLAPKVTGTLSVEQVFADAPPLDFVVHFSSRSAADGLVGGADYAAANAFLDAMAGESQLADGRVLSVDWPVWTGVGMAEESDVDIAGLARTVARLSKGAPARKPASEPTGEVVREVELGAATDWVLDEHRVNRIPLLPGTAYLDLLVRTFREDVAPAEGGAVVLEDVVFRAPFYDQKPRRLRLAFRQAGDGHEFTAASRPVADESAPWVVHVTGRASRTREEPPSVDVETIRTRLLAAGAKPNKAQGRTAFILGPRWQNLTDQWAAGEEKLVRVELSPAFHDDLDRHALHPALLDTVTAAVRTPEQRSTVPFLYRRLVAHQDLPATFLAHVRRRDSAGTDTAAGDLDLVTEDGAVLATVEGFTMRQVDLSTVWEQAPAPEPVSEQAPAVATDGLDPQRGVLLLLDMLAARLAGTVLVRPFANGRPLPLAEHPVPQAPTPVTPVPVVRTPIVVDPEPVVAVAVPAPVQVTGEGLAGRVRRLWMDALGVDSVEDGHDFFEAGGNSLTAIDIMAHVREMFGIELSIGLLLEARTFGELVSVLHANGAN